MAEPTLFYVSVNILPNPNANSVQILDFLSNLSHKNDVTLIAPLSVDRRELAELGFSGRVIEVPHRRGQKHLATLFAVWKIGGRGDHIITRNILYGLISSLFFRRRVLVELHHELSSLEIRLVRIVGPSLIRIVAIAPTLANSLRRAGVKAVQCIPLSTSGWPDRQVDETGAAECYDCGYVGSNAPGKGVQVIIKAARISPQRTFLLVGMSARSIEDIPSNVTVIDKIRHDEVPGLIDACRILLAPYESEVYGADGKRAITSSISPLKLFEYMSRARPIIVSRLAAIAEQLGEDPPMKFIEPDNPIELRDAIEALLKNPEDRRDLGRRAYALWHRRYRTSTRVPALLDFLDQPLDQVN